MSNIARLNFEPGSCIFCNSDKAELMTGIEGHNWVQCFDCHAHGPLTNTPSEAIQNWENVRKGTNA